jgi:proline dehydrogenase
VKIAVDDAIDQCSAVYHLREAIEEAHTRAEEATDEKQKRVYAAKGMNKNFCR